MVGRASSTTSIVHADMTLTRSKVKVKVKVTGLLNFRKLAEPWMLAAMTVSPLAGLSGLYMLPMSMAPSSSAMFTIGRIAYRREGILFPTDNKPSVSLAAMRPYVKLF